MIITQYTAAKANVLNKMPFPDLDFPINLKILWIETVDEAYISSNVLKESHEHSFFEIHLVLSGKISYSCGGNDFSLGCGQALFLPAGITHKYINHTSDILKTAIAFSVDENALELLQLQSAKTKSVPFSKDVAQSFDFILKEIENCDIFTRQIILGRTVEMLYSLLKSFNIEIPKSNINSLDPRLLVAKTFIENNSDKVITCSAVAKECCLSTKHLCRIFKNELGISPSEYITNTKIKQAKKHLANNKYSIKEIGFLLGFENEGSFVSFFKRHCKTTPGAFRKQMSQK